MSILVAMLQIISRFKSQDEWSFQFPMASGNRESNRGQVQTLFLLLGYKWASSKISSSQ